MHLLKLHQAYGRALSLKDARQDFLTGKDFSVTRRGGPYTSIRDFTAEPKEETVDFDGVILLAVDRETDQVVHCVLTIDEMKENLK